MTAIIKNILFDIGEVLVNINWPLGHAFMQGLATDETGQALMGPSLHEKIFSEKQRAHWNRYGVGEITTVEFMELFHQTLPQDSVIYSGDRETLAKAVSHTFEPLPERIQTLNELIAGGQYNVALLSDNNELHATYIENNMPDIFTHIPEERRFYSYRLGSQKKSGPKAYQKALDLWGVNAEETLMIDDRIQNKDGAERLGIHFMLLAKTDDLKARLKNEYGI
ncbi:MAG TPA: HAD family hydrolase [Alphaproteobacteria bacterium]